MRRPSDWGHPCPNPECPQYNLINREKVRGLSPYLTRSGKRRLLHCKSWGTNFSETRDPVFFDLRTPEEKVRLALKMLRVKVDLAGISFVLGVTEETTLEGLRRAAHQAPKINAPLLRELPGTEVQRDEMWTVITRKYATAAEPNGESSDASPDGRPWLWLSYAPEGRLMLAAVVGPRTYARARRLIQLTAALIVGGPGFFSDGFSSSWPARLATDPQLKAFARPGKRGRPRQPILEPQPDLVSGQGSKPKGKGRLRALK